MSSATDSESPASRKRVHSVTQRRQNKPLIEKRRRARINECLLQLKALLMKDMGKESPRPSKLEKADILEMTVDYIKKIAEKKTDTQALSSTGRASPGAPFLDGFSRCMEEVDTFLDNQLHLLPEVRHKLLSHCREQLTSRDLKLEDPSDRAGGSLRSVSPDSDGDKSVCDSASEASSSDEETGRAKRFRHADDVKVSSEVTTSSSSTTTTNVSATTTASVAPFQHTSGPTVVAASPQMCAHNTPSSNSGIKLAGPLKLICGGNVFIVVDQQQHPQQPTLQQPQLLQQTSPQKLEGAQPLAASPVLSVGSLPSVASPILYSPALYSTPAFTTTYIPTLPQVNVNQCIGVPTSTVPLVTTTAGIRTADQKVATVTGGLSLVSKPAGLGLTPPAQPSPEIPVSAGSDVNNNDVGLVQQGSLSMWRPW